MPMGTMASLTSEVVVYRNLIFVWPRRQKTDYFFLLVQLVLTFGSNIFLSKLFSTLPLLVLAASRRKRARSTRANVGLSNIDGVRLGGPEFVSDVTSISVLSMLTIFNALFRKLFFPPYCLSNVFPLNWVWAQTNKSVNGVVMKSINFNCAKRLPPYIPDIYMASRRYSRITGNKIVDVRSFLAR